MQKTSPVFLGAIVVAVIAVILAVYYFIPGVYHILTFNGDANSTRPTHGFAFIAIAVICVIAALVTRPKKA